LVREGSSLGVQEEFRRDLKDRPIKTRDDGAWFGLSSAGFLTFPPLVVDLVSMGIALGYRLDATIQALLR